jgi:hypothetical protein
MSGPVSIRCRRVQSPLVRERGPKGASRFLVLPGGDVIFFSRFSARAESGQCYEPKVLSRRGLAWEM